MLSEAAFAIASVVLLAPLGIFIERTRRQGLDVWYAVGSGLMVAGALATDVTRLWGIGSQPWTPLVAAAVSLTGLGVVVRCTHRPWRELVSDAFLVSGASLLAALSAVTLVTRVTDDARVTVDVACLIGAALSMQLVPRLTHSVTAMPVIDRALTYGYFAARLGVWLVIVSDCLAVTSIGMTAPRILTIAGVAVLVALAGLQRGRPVTPVVSHQEVPERLLPFVLTAAAALITGVGMAFDRRLATAPIILLTVAVAIVTVARQILTWSALRRAVRSATEREEYFRALVQDASDVIVIATSSGALEYVSPAVRHVMGVETLPARGTVSDLIDIDLAGFRAAVSRLEAQETVRIDATRGDRVYEAALRAHGERILISIGDITERELLQRHLHDLAFTDVLTGLANRSRLVDELERRLGNPSTAGRTAALFVDLDRFKPINDASGHAVGDLVLRQVADRLRDAAGPGGFVARHGGDEFLLVVDTLGVDVLVLARRMAEAVAQTPFQVGGHQYRLGASVGVAFGEPGTSADEIIRRADVAMFAAKRGGHVVTAYDPSMGLAAAARLREDSDAAAALARSDLLMYLQPVVDVARCRVAWCEALLRWRDRDGVVRDPHGLLRYTAQVDRGVGVTWWMLRAVADRLATDRSADTSIAVNIPSAILGMESLPRDISEMLVARGVRARLLELEITEEAMVEQGQVALDVADRLRSAGFHLHIDDFGTGYSSLGYLTRLPVSTVKIDRSFTSDLPTSRASRSVVRGLVGLADELGLRVVGEGVETEEQHDWLRLLGVRYAQGYWYARPEDASKITDRSDLASWASARMSSRTSA